ncbi:anti-repressor SinI family protein [Brevibacillus brevis]|uniref:Anti-repressor SinI family protein n=1 Tax=Brevibacillus brevis TaxID=1393 RepID=A0ABY9T036_BREBE|nr:anti-repressor SinI family protein [Brevibacillus brevis]WNC13346.1 anti-repressor SinI family protein [Brevibacillus brevis]
MGANKAVTEEIDSEWKELIMEAKRLGIPVDEIRQFLLVSVKKYAANE